MIVTRKTRLWFIYSALRVNPKRQIRQTHSLSDNNNNTNNNKNNNDYIDGRINFISISLIRLKAPQG